MTPSHQNHIYACEICSQRAAVKQRKSPEILHSECIQSGKDHCCGQKCGQIKEYKKKKP